MARGASKLGQLALWVRRAVRSYLYYRLVEVVIA